MARITPGAISFRPLYCTCPEDGAALPSCPIHGQDNFQTNITTANNLIGEWGRIAASIARQCKWRPQGQCLKDCQGIAVCNLDGLTLVDAQGRPVAH